MARRARVPRQPPLPRLLVKQARQRPPQRRCPTQRCLPPAPEHQHLPMELPRQCRVFQCRMWPPPLTVSRCSPSSYRSLICVTQWRTHRPLRVLALLPLLKTPRLLRQLRWLLRVLRQRGSAPAARQVQRPVLASVVTRLGQAEVQVVGLALGRKRAQSLQQMHHNSLRRRHQARAKERARTKGRAREKAAKKRRTRCNCGHPTGGTIAFVLCALVDVFAERG